MDIDNDPGDRYTEYPTRLLSLSRGIARLEPLGVAKNFRKDYVLIEPSAIPVNCYVVKKGRVIAYEYTKSGEERIYNFMEENAILLEANLLMNKPVPVYFKTAKPCNLICIEREALRCAMIADPGLMMDIIESVSYKFLSSMDQIRQANLHSATWKLCNLLLIFADRFASSTMKCRTDAARRKNDKTYRAALLIEEKITAVTASNNAGPAITLAQ